MPRSPNGFVRKGWVDDGSGASLEWFYGGRRPLCAGALSARRAVAGLSDEPPPGSPETFSRIDSTLAAGAPTQVRVIPTSKLMREGGQAAVDRAVADISLTITG
jgi:hypothetical protein